MFAKAAARTPPGTVQLKPRSAWKLIGAAAPRTDIVAKANVTARFGIDVRSPEMLSAVVRHPPALGGSPGAVNDSAALALPGVLRIVRLGSYAGSTAALAVVGRTYWHAKRGADALQVDWRARPAGALDSRAIMTALEASAKNEDGLAFHSQGDARETLAQSSRVAGVKDDDVTLHVTYLGGGFGRRLDIDFIGQVVRVAMELNGRPAQLVWPREEDLTHDFYRPAGVALMQASFGADGCPETLAITSAGDAVTPRSLERAMPGLAGPIDRPDKTASEGLPVGCWRAVGHSHKALFSESFIDELVHEATQDPVAFRMALLASMPRRAAVLQHAANKAGWSGKLPPGASSPRSPRSRSNKTSRACTASFARSIAAR